jgi:hypothetical protein
LLKKRNSQVKKLGKAVKAWKLRQLDRNVFSLDVDFRWSKEWEFWFLLTADQHWDNPHSNHALQLKHLQQARERNAAVMSAGDYFCLMQGKYDKRASKSSVRPEHQVDNYLDAVVCTGADFLAPYADLYTVIAEGNHDAAINNKHETSIIDRFCGVLADRIGHSIYNGGYSGYLIFKFAKNNQRHTIVLRYEHGAGAGAPITGGVIDSFRRGVYFPDSDIIVSGHNHNSWTMEFARQRIDRRSGKLRQDIQTHIKCPSYKDEFDDGVGGWATATKGMPPKPPGAYWLRFSFDMKTEQIIYEVIKAS